MTYKIFLASSNELKPERLQFADFINQQNIVLQEKNVFLQLSIWEYLPDEVTLAGSQESYNKDLRTCEIFVLLYWTKMGKYTRIEYETAFSKLQQNGKTPKIFVYEKTTVPPKEVTEAEKESLSEFKEFLRREPQHFPTQFETYDRLENAFKKSLEALFESGFLTYGERAKTLYSDGMGVPVNFIGRDEELKAIKERLDNGGSLMLINAEGGIGKTSLAAKYWQENLYSYKTNAWLFCENGIIQAMMKLAPALDIDLSGLDEKQQVNALLQSLQNVSNDFLLVLDNANDPKEIELFKNTFRGLHWHVLITSRSSGILEEKQEYRIVHLPPFLAKVLFKKNYTENSSEFEALLDKVLEAINYHTLLVEMFSKNMLQLGELGETLADFLDHLETKGLFLEEHSFKIVTDYPANVQKVAGNTDAILVILYDFSKLDEAERYWLVNMALMPAVNHTMVFLIELYQPENKVEFRNRFKNLSEKGWLTTDKSGYRISPVVQQLVLLKNEATLTIDGRILVENLNKLLENNGHKLWNISYAKARGYVQFVPAISKKLSKFPYSAVGMLNFNAGNFHEDTGNMVLSKKSYSDMLDIFKSLHEASPENLEYKNGLAISYERRGRVYELRGDQSNALKNYLELQRLSKEIFEASPENLKSKNGLAISYERLGLIYEQTGDRTNALKYYIEMQRLAEEVYKASPDVLHYKDCLAISYERLGGMYEQIGDYPNALKNYEERRRLAEEIYKANPEILNHKNGLAIAYSRLGDIFDKVGDWNNALNNYFERQRLGIEIYEASPENLNYKHGLTISYQQTGRMYEQSGDWPNALKNYSESQRLGKEIYEASPENLAYKQSLAISYKKLGEIFYQSGDFFNAFKNYKESHRLGKEIYKTNPENLTYKQSFAISYEKLGEIYEKNDDLSNALMNYKEELNLFKEICETGSENLEYKYGLAGTFGKIGGVYQMADDLHNAMKNYMEGLSLFRELNEINPKTQSFKFGLAVSYSRIGDIKELNGEGQDALINYNNAMLVFTEMHKESPENVSYNNGLAVCLSVIGTFFLNQGDKFNARIHYQKAKEILKQIANNHPEYSEYKFNLDFVNSVLNDL